jgi:nitric oxide reductase subunit C
LTVAQRKVLIACLVAAFFVQTWLVYADRAGHRTPPLSEHAARGQQVWHDNNCQSCHQIFGFGGFLGPDLTNSAGTLTEARLDLILTDGAGLMPAFHLGAEDRAAVLQFLTEVDKTGVSQPRLAAPVPTDELLDHLVKTVTERGDALTDAEQAGLAVMRREKCIACHLPNQSSPVLAPDLTLALGKHGREKVLAILAAGVPGTTMPKFTFPDAEREGVVAMLGWLAKHADAAASVFEVTRPGGGSGWSIPWFEYE